MEGRLATSPGGRGAAGASGAVAVGDAGPVAVQPRGRAPLGGSARPGECGRPGHRTLQHADPFGKRLGSRVEVGSHRSHRSDFEDHLRVGCLAHVDQRMTQNLHAAHDPGQPHGLGKLTEPLKGCSRDRAQLGCQCGEEDLAQVVDQLRGQLLGTPATGQQRAERDEHGTDVSTGQGLEHCSEFGTSGIGGP